MEAGKEAAVAKTKPKTNAEQRDGSDDRFFAAARAGNVAGAWYFCGEENYAKQKAL